jgi:hypothetical protein
MQSQGCQQAMDEAEKDYKKLSERIAESREAMKVIPLSLSFQKLDLEYNINGSLFFFQASYEEFMVEAQATAARGKQSRINFKRSNS